MKLIISGRNIQLTEAIKETVRDKLTKLNEHYDFVKETHVFLSVEKNPRIAESQKAEATVHVNGGTLRITANSQDLYASLDLLVDKIDRGLRRYKTKMLHRTKSGRSAGGESIRHIGDLEDRLQDPELLASVDEDDAIEQFEDGVWIAGQQYEGSLWEAEASEELTSASAPTGSLSSPSPLVK